MYDNNNIIIIIITTIIIIITSLFIYRVHPLPGMSRCHRPVLLLLFLLVCHHHRRHQPLLILLRGTLDWISNRSGEVGCSTTLGILVILKNGRLGNANPRGKKKYIYILLSRVQTV